MNLIQTKSVGNIDILSVDSARVELLHKNKDLLIILPNITYDFCRFYQQMDLRLLRLIYHNESSVMTFNRFYESLQTLQLHDNYSIGEVTSSTAFLQPMLSLFFNNYAMPIILHRTINNQYHILEQATTSFGQYTINVYSERTFKAMYICGEWSIHFFDFDANVYIQRLQEYQEEKYFVTDDNIHMDVGIHVDVDDVLEERYDADFPNYIASRRIVFEDMKQSALTRYSRTTHVWQGMKFKNYVKKEKLVAALLNISLQNARQYFFKKRPV